MISRRRLHLLIALLLPLMVMRSLLPAGYMAVAEHGELRIAMCSAGLPASDSDAPTQGSGDPGTADACVFAHAATVAPPAQAGVAHGFPPESARFSPRESSTQPPATGPPRVAAARAPPTFPI